MRLPITLRPEAPLAAPSSGRAALPVRPSETTGRCDCRSRCGPRRRLRRRPQDVRPCPYVRLKRPVDAIADQAAARGAACGAVLRTCGPRPCVRLKRPVDAIADHAAARGAACGAVLRTCG